MELIVPTKNLGNKSIFIDSEDYHLIKKYNWHVQKDKLNLYGRAHIRNKDGYKCLKMHRVIMGILDSNIHIDHINGNGLDNRRCNLRIATIAENSRNVGKNSRNTTGYKGVYMYKSGPSKGLFTATLRCKSEKYHGGYFKTAIEAAKKYDEMSKKYHGEFGYLNFK